MRIGVVTLFPQMFAALDADGVVGRAGRDGKWSMTLYNPRDHASDTHRTVDDEPYGGGPGMVLKPEPLAGAIDAARAALPDARVTFLSPAGRMLDDALARQMSRESEHIFLCGRYQGIDERIVASRVDRQVSVGNFIASGGELPAMLLMDALVRFLPGVVGSEESLAAESFADGGLAAPCYTRPAIFEGMEVPEQLLSGDHRRIRQWRQAAAAGREKDGQEGGCGL